MNEPAITEALTEIFRDLFGNDDIILSPEMTADDVEGWDSIKHISLIVAIEDQFNIKLNTSEIEALKIVGDLQAIIGQKTK